MRYALVVCAVLVLGLAACTQNAGQSTSPRQRLANASEATAGEGTAAFSMEVSTDVGGDGGGEDGTGGDGGQGGTSGAAATMTFSGEGVMDFDENVGRMEMQVPGMGMTLQTVFHEGQVYTQVPSSLGGNGQWIRQGDVQPDTPVGDPTGLVQILDAVEGDIEELGSDEIRGTEVDGFGFTVPGSELAPASEEASDAMSGVDVPIEVWLDEENRVRRMVMQVDMAALTGAAGGQSGEGNGGGQQAAESMTGTATVTVEYFDFGTEVDVQVPSDEEVLDAEQLQRQMQGQFLPQDLPSQPGQS